MPAKERLKSYGLFFKVPENPAKKVHAPGTSLHRYEGIWKQAVFRVEDDKALRLAVFLPVLKKAVKLRSDGLARCFVTTP